MKRIVAMLLASVLLAAAGPHTPSRTKPEAPPLPLPPPLPADPPTDLAAPMPRADYQSPDGWGADQRPFALRVFPMQQFGTGEGYIPGSAYQSPELRKPMQTPGFMVTVPLQ